MRWHDVDGRNGCVDRDMCGDNVSTMFPTSVTNLLKVYFKREQREKKTFQFIANCEIVTPRAFGASKQERFLVIDIIFVAYTQN